MRKYGILLLVVLTALFLNGCGQTTDAKVSTIVIEKNGEIKGIVIEDFSQPNYDEQQLKDTIQEEVSDYNAQEGKERIKVEDIVIDNSIAKLVMMYKSYEDYMAFNKNILFVGTMEEALASGYELDVTLVEPNDKEISIAKEELLEMKDKTIVISEEPTRIRVYGKIKYCSPDADVSEKNELATHNINGLSYIVL